MENLKHPKITNDINSLIFQPLKYSHYGACEVTSRPPFQPPFFIRLNFKKLTIDKIRGVAKGGGYGGQNPPHWPKYFGHFYQNSNKTTFGRVSAALPQP